MTQSTITIFKQSINDYHQFDCVNHKMQNPYTEKTIEHLLYHKNWIDTVQWHLEDIIRDPNIDPIKALEIKRRIDVSNQERTDMVEYLDSYFLDTYKNIEIAKNATFNTETPAWAFDRLSILELKIYHMQQEVNRENSSIKHRENCIKKLQTLLLQEYDLAVAIVELLSDMASGKKYMKVYKQMKMYNDPEMNPVLYG